MSYESAPQTTMLATHCAACGRPLCDSVSVETGMGPHCRAKHGYEIDVPPDVRAAANLLVHKIAVAQDGPSVPVYVNCLRDLGFDVLADRITQRVASIEITVDGDRLVVSTPYCPDSVAMARRIPGRRWDADRKVNTFPATARQAVWAMLKACFAGHTGNGPKGLFEVA